MLRATLFVFGLSVALCHALEFAGHGGLVPGMSVSNSDQGSKYTLVRQLHDDYEHKKYISHLKSTGAGRAEHARAEHQHTYALNLLEISNKLVGKEVSFHSTEGSDVTLKVDREANRGTFGVIWLVKDEKEGVPYALKVFDTPIYERYAEKSFRSANDFKAEMWKLEKEACETVHDSANDEGIPRPFLKGKESLLNYVAAFKSDGSYFILYPLYDGDFQKLQDDMGLGGHEFPALSSDEMGTVVEKVLSGVAYLHQRKILHRDLKPANILYSRDDGKVKDVIVADFGLYKKNPKLRNSCGRTGTKSFLPPENFSDFCVEMKGNHNDLFAADTWGVAVTLLAMISQKLTDETPLWGLTDDWKQLRCQPMDSSCNTEWPYYEWKSKDYDSLRKLHLPRFPQCIRIFQKYNQAWWTNLLLGMSDCSYMSRMSAIEGYMWVLYENALSKFELSESDPAQNDPMPRFTMNKTHLAKMWKYTQRLLKISRSLDRVRRAMSAAIGENIGVWELERRILQLRTDLVTIGTLGSHKPDLDAHGAAMMNEAIRRVKTIAAFFMHRIQEDQMGLMKSVLTSDRNNQRDIAAAASLRWGGLRKVVDEILQNAYKDLRGTIEKLQNRAESLEPIVIPSISESQREKHSLLHEPGSEYHDAHSSLSSLS